MPEWDQILVASLTAKRVESPQLNLSCAPMQNCALANNPHVCLPKCKLQQVEFVDRPSPSYSLHVCYELRVSDRSLLPSTPTPCPMPPSALTRTSRRPRPASRRATYATHVSMTKATASQVSLPSPNPNDGHTFARLREKTTKSVTSASLMRYSRRTATPSTLDVDQCLAQVTSEVASREMRSDGIRLQSIPSKWQSGPWLSKHSVTTTTTTTTADVQRRARITRHRLHASPTVAHWTKVEQDDCEYTYAQCNCPATTASLLNAHCQEQVVGTTLHRE